jgi:hypothetical protein
MVKFKSNWQERKITVVCAAGSCPLVGWFVAPVWMPTCYAQKFLFFGWEFGMPTVDSAKWVRYLRNNRRIRNPNTSSSRGRNLPKAMLGRNSYGVNTSVGPGEYLSNGGLARGSNEDAYVLCPKILFFLFCMAGELPTVDSAKWVRYLQKLQLRIPKPPVGESIPKRSHVRIAADSAMRPN